MTSPTRRYNTRQVCDLLGIHKTTLLEWIAKKHVPDAKRDWRGWRVWTDKDIAKVRAFKEKPRPLFIPRPAPRRSRVPEPAGT